MQPRLFVRLASHHFKTQVFSIDSHSPGFARSQLESGIHSPNSHHPLPLPWVTRPTMSSTWVHSILLYITQHYTNITWSLGVASIADAHHHPISFSHHWHRSTPMSQPYSPNTTPATAPSPVITARDIGLQPIRHSLTTSLSCPRVAAVVSICLIYNLVASALTIL